MITPAASPAATVRSAGTAGDLFLTLMTLLSESRRIPPNSSWVFPFTSCRIGEAATRLAAPARGGGWTHEEYLAGPVRYARSPPGTPLAEPWIRARRLPCGQD